VNAALAGVRVLELADESAEYCGRLLAGLGAEVVKIEPPSGAASRSFGPYLDDRPDPDRSLSFWADNLGKLSVVLDDLNDDAAGTLRALCRSADVLVHTMRASEATASGLDFASLSELNPRLIVCALTPFGQDGPWADYEADDLVLMALGGSMAACGYRPGPDGVYDTPPLASMGEQAYRTASTYAAIAILAALWARDSEDSSVAGGGGGSVGGASAGGEGGGSVGGGGQLIDVSAHECSASMTEWHLLSYICSGDVYRRAPHPSLTANDGRRVAALIPDFLGSHVFENLLAMLERNDVAGPLTDPQFKDPGYRAANYSELWQALKRLAALHDGEGLYRQGQSAGLPWGVIRSPDEVVADPHLAARGHFVEIEHPELHMNVTYPGAPFVASSSPWVAGPRPPLLGEHTEVVLAGWGARCPESTGNPDDGAGDEEAGDEEAGDEASDEASDEEARN
jgi:crotonobetainyl-CoA:carnitine CoA-transferase CaiB-like acyl-CoA transferase